MRALLFSLGCLVAIAAGCGSDPAPEPTPDPATRTVDGIEVSDAVPTLEELREIGLTDSQAECFTREIDPDGTGRVASAELFTAAFAACF